MSYIGNVPANHPALVDHFPGQPIVPAVVMLQLLDEAMRACGHADACIGVSRLRFLAPLVPGEDCEVTFSAKSNGDFDAKISQGGKAVLSGILKPAG